MSTTDNDLKPEELGQAAAPAIADALTRDFPGVAQVLAEAGLLGVCAHEKAGGLGLDMAFALPIVAEAGKMRLHWPLLETIAIAKALGASPLAADVVSGARVATWALQGSLVEGFAGHARHAQEADWILLADGQGGAALLDRRAVRIEEDKALDPDYPQAWLTPPAAPTQDQVLARLDTATYAALRRDAQILVAGYVNGAAEGALQATADYLSTRVQFGRPLARLGPVAQMLADSWTEIEMARLLTYRAAAAAVHDSAAALPQSSMAKLAATEAACRVVDRCVQVMGRFGLVRNTKIEKFYRQARPMRIYEGASEVLRLGIARQLTEEVK